ncbi:MAG TPA: hypothetical protein VIX86_13610 [Streptosporangiaceae bacterium]
MIRVSHVALPPGLNALAQRGPDDELIVYVSDALPSDRQRAAVRIALRASRRRDWRAMLPVPSAALLALGLGRLRRAAGLIRAHWISWGTATAVVAAGSAAVYIAAVPHGPHPAAARPPAPVTSLSPVPSPAASPPGAHPHPSPSGHPGRAGSTAGPAPAVSPTSVATLVAQPTPTSHGPSSTPSPTAPAPPSPTPSPQGTGHCIILLGVRVCLGVKL